MGRKEDLSVRLAKEGFSMRERILGHGYVVSAFGKKFKFSSLEDAEKFSSEHLLGSDDARLQKDPTTSGRVSIPCFRGGKIKMSGRKYWEKIASEDLEVEEMKSYPQFLVVRAIVADEIFRPMSVQVSAVGKFRFIGFLLGLCESISGSPVTYDLGLKTAYNLRLGSAAGLYTSVLLPVYGEDREVVEALLGIWKEMTLNDRHLFAREVGARLGARLFFEGGEPDGIELKDYVKAYMDEAMRDSDHADTWVGGVSP